MLAIACALLTSSAALAADEQWDAAVFREASEIQIFTNDPDGGHWSRMWVVVIDGHPYLRLGPRAAERIRENTDAPWVKVRVDGREYSRVQAIDAPEMSERVFEAMAQKYRFDFVIRPFRREGVVRLVPEGVGAQQLPSPEAAASRPP
jgi:hypothetical protein